MLMLISSFILGENSKIVTPSAKGGVDSCCNERSVAECRDMISIWTNIYTATRTRCGNMDQLDVKSALKNLHKNKLKIFPCILE